MAVNGECTLSELTKELHISVPTITKLVQELVDENIVTDLGKVETPGGRRPNIFGLANSAIYFAGVNVGRDNMRFLITDLAKQHHQRGERLHVRAARPSAVHRAHLLEHRELHRHMRHRPRQDSRAGRLHDGTREPRHGPQLQIFHVERTVVARLARRARRHPRTAGERHPRPLLCRIHLRQIEGREQRAVPPHGPRRGHRHRGRRTALLRQERLRRRVRPHSLLRQRDHLLVRQEGLPRNRGFGHRHRGQDVPPDPKGREHHPQARNTTSRRPSTSTTSSLRRRTTTTFRSN